MRSALRILIPIGTMLLSDSGLGQKLTFSDDIFPILREHCTICHYQGGPTPFALTTYEKVAEKANFIVYVTENNVMPPWKANRKYRHFENERGISDDEIKQIKDWIEQGKKRGKKLKPSKTDVRPPELSNPNLKLMMPEALDVPGKNQNYYMTYKIPFEIERDTFAKGFEFIPGNTEVLHHASFQILKVHDEADIFNAPYYGVAQGGQILDDGAFYKMLNLVGPNGEFPKILYSNSWLPGSTPQIFDSELGFKLPKRGVVLFNFIHYSPSPIDQKDSSGIRFFYSNERPTKVLHELLLKPNIRGNQGYIPKDSIKKIRFRKPMREEITLHTIIPHMHRLGKYFKAYGVEPSGDTIPLIEIENWDFFWQEYYQIEGGLTLKRGTWVYVEAIFDNTDSNGQNPFHPPRDIYLEDSMNEESEMLHFIFLYTTSD